MCTLAELEVSGSFPEHQNSQNNPFADLADSEAVPVPWAGCKRWVTIPEERGCDMEVSALDCVVVEGFEAVKKCEDADEEEWHIPMTNP